MPTEAAVRDWIQLPSGLFVSSRRMQNNGKMLSLYDAANMDIVAFNNEAEKYGVHMDESDAPIDKFVKYSIFLSRRDKDGSFIPTNAEYVDMALRTASAKAKDWEPLASFYEMFRADLRDVTREVLGFKERLFAGANKGKYVAERWVFNEDGMLSMSAGDTIIAPEGWTRVLGSSGYALETSKHACFIENIEDPTIAGTIIGYWYVGSDPVGQQRLVIRSPHLYNEGAFRASVNKGRSYSSEYVGALRLRDTIRDTIIEDYRAKIEKARADLWESDILPR